MKESTASLLKRNDDLFKFERYKRISCVLLPIFIPVASVKAPPNP